MDAGLEQSLRAIVAEVLCVEIDEVLPSVSLVDDLAADSLDLVAIVAEVEDQLGVRLGETAAIELRSHGDLVVAVAEALHDRLQRVTSEPLFVRARVVSPASRAPAGITRAEWLSPYTVDAIADECRRAGRGARLEVTVGAELSDAALEEVYRRLERISARGTPVVVRRETPLDEAAPATATPAAA